MPVADEAQGSLNYMTGLSSESRQAPCRRRSLDPATVLLVLLALMLTVAMLRSISWGHPITPVPPAVTTVDPNLAPWWELTVLPRIGETLASRIVEHRESTPRLFAEARPLPVYTAVEDLQDVRGIGPKTLQRIGPYLALGD